MTNEVYVWTIPLDRPANQDELRSVLSPDERQRADRFLSERDRARFATCRASLRRILAGLLDTNPSEISFQYSPFGKPSLAENEGLHFNVSHSNHFALVAVAMGRAVGVDVEFARADFATDAVAQRFFSPLEREALGRLPAESRTEAFFRCWTRKEAFIKAIGEGLSFPLDRFDVTLAPNEPPRLLRGGEDPESAKRWSLHDLPAPTGYFAALAIEGEARIVERADLPN
jgi:4'-phosphopantetheinyl transferase